jgi:hypothetical protein
MLDMKPVEGLIVLMDPAVLAPLACPAPDQLTPFGHPSGMLRAFQESPGLGLDDCQIVGKANAGFVLFAFLGRELSLVAFFGQFVHAGLQIRISAELHQRLGHLACEVRTTGSTRRSRVRVFPCMPSAYQRRKPRNSADPVAIRRQELLQLVENRVIGSFSPLNFM